jgi:hypothetical protein
MKLMRLCRQKSSSLVGMLLPEDPEDYTLSLTLAATTALAVAAGVDPGLPLVTGSCKSQPHR